ncbi:MAG: FlgB family protein [Pseudomonadota bacterium]
MIGDIKLFQLASALTRHSSDRHQVIAQNIANADTPGYRAKDVEAFSDAVARMDRAGQGPARVNGVPDAVTWRIAADPAAGAVSPNGNSVTLEDQMMKSVETEQNHEAATTIYRKAMEILRTSMRSNT